MGGRNELFFILLTACTMRYHSIKFSFHYVREWTNVTRKCPTTIKSQLMEGIRKKIRAAGENGMYSVINWYIYIVWYVLFNSRVVSMWCELNLKSYSQSNLSEFTSYTDIKWTYSQWTLTWIIAIPLLFSVISCYHSRTKNTPFFSIYAIAIPLAALGNVVHLWIEAT